MLRASFRGAALLLALALGGGAAADERIGAVVEPTYTGAVGERAGQQGAEQLFFQHEVYSEQRVKTHREARTRLQFLDATELTVGGNSNVLLDRFVYDPDSGAGEAAITFGKGVFRFVTGNIRTKEAVTLKTPTATIAIRGTHLVLTVRGDGSAVIGVVEGAVLVQPCGGAAAVEAAAPATVELARTCQSPQLRAGVEVPAELEAQNRGQEKGGFGDKDRRDPDREKSGRKGGNAG